MTDTPKPRRRNMGRRRFTVLFFVDTEHAVETFCEHVRADTSGEAFEKAKAKARRGGYSNSGHGVGAHEWENATEIATFDGWQEQSR